MTVKMTDPGTARAIGRIADGLKLDTNVANVEPPPPPRAPATGPAPYRRVRRGFEPGDKFACILVGYPWAPSRLRSTF